MFVYEVSFPNDKKEITDIPWILLLIFPGRHQALTTPFIWMCVYTAQLPPNERRVHVPAGVGGTLL